MTDTLWVVIALLMGLASVGVALLKYYRVTRQPTGDPRRRTSLEAFAEAHVSS
jgi:hypothetical protein